MFLCRTYANSAVVGVILSTGILDAVRSGRGRVTPDFSQQIKIVDVKLLVDSDQY